MPRERLVSMVQKNTAELWDGVWTRPATIEKDLYTVAKEERLIRWQRMEAMVLDRYGGFEDLSVIEIGAGRGTNAALMAQRGASVAVLDYSDIAMERARRLFEEMDLPVDFILQDALDLPESLLNRFDVSMSFGLAEHFLGDKRTGFLKAHLDLLNDGGLTFISVPNTHNPPYRLHKWITERTGRWGAGEEYPFSRQEFESYCAQLGVGEFGFFGDSLLRSKKFLNPLKWLPRRKKKTPQHSNATTESTSVNGGTVQSKRPYRRRLPRRERGTSLDAYYSYALVLWACKPT